MGSCLNSRADVTNSFGIKGDLTPPDDFLKDFWFVCVSPIVSLKWYMNDFLLMVLGGGGGVDGRKNDNTTNDRL